MALPNRELEVLRFGHSAMFAISALPLKHFSAGEKSGNGRALRPFAGRISWMDAYHHAGNAWNFVSCNILVKTLPGEKASIHS